MDLNSLYNLDFNISEIFYSIQGESSRAGMPCVFVRFQGCEIRCSWCDTAYSLDIKQKELSYKGIEIIREIEMYNCNYILFTGGEPLYQPNTVDLMNFLADSGYLVSVETNGHQDISMIDNRVVKILDLKCPGSGMEKYNNYKNLDYLTNIDEIKFVIKDKNDYLWAKEKVINLNLNDKVYNVIFSPVFNQMDYQELANWILADNLPVRMQLQIHKYIWEPNQRGV